MLLDRAALIEGLADLGRRAEAGGKIIDLSVYGESCPILVSNFGDASQDVDAVAWTDQPFVDKIVAEAAAERGWPRDWSCALHRQPRTSLCADHAAMDAVYLLDLASRKSAWLAARQATVAQNIANINAPGYKQKDLVAFDDVLARTHLDLASTSPGHLPIGDSGETGATTSDDDGGFEVTESGNTVGLETQMGKAGEISRDYSLTTNIVKSFHAMLMASLKE